MGIIYLLQDGKHTSSNIYKIGKTRTGYDSHGKLNRIKVGYAENTNLICTWDVPDAQLDHVELHIRLLLRHNHILSKGVEWFQANVLDIQQDIDDIMYALTHDDHFSEKLKQKLGMMQTKQYIKLRNVLENSYSLYAKTLKLFTTLEGKYGDNVALMTIKNNLTHIHDIDLKNCRESLNRRTNNMSIVNDLQMIRTDDAHYIQTLKKISNQINSLACQIYKLVDQQRIRMTNHQGDHDGSKVQLFPEGT